MVPFTTNIMITMRRRRSVRSSPKPSIGHGSPGCAQGRTMAFRMYPRARAGCSCRENCFYRKGTRTTDGHVQDLQRPPDSQHMCNVMLRSHGMLVLIGTFKYRIMVSTLSWLKWLPRPAEDAARHTATDPADVEICRGFFIPSVSYVVYLFPSPCLDTRARDTW